MRDKLTATRLAALRRCPRQHWYRFEVGLGRIRTTTPLRIGKAFHRGLELEHTLFGQDVEALLSAALEDYAVIPDWADPIEWAVERETLAALLRGHFWRYSRDDLEFLAVELTFDLPLTNPATGGRSHAFRLAGKMDAVVRLPDGRIAVLEYKTCGEDISPASDYWLRLRSDGQISQYVLAARAMGYDAATVIYDVTRKPTIRLRKSETPEAYGARLLEDIGNRPDYYYQRREVPRLEDELEVYRAELWQQAKHLLGMRRRARKLARPDEAHFRNVGRWTCSRCDYSQLCLAGAHLDPASPPVGFCLLPDVNPELQDPEE
jgi:RecB family exonuclease